MARQATGQVVVRKRARGRVYGLRFRAGGERHYITLADGTTAEQAATELDNVLADVRRGTWKPTVAPEPPKEDPTFHEFASEWFEARRREIGPGTAGVYRNDLVNHLLPWFAKHRLSQITVAEVDRYRDHKLAEGALSRGSINKTLARLGQILDTADEYGLITRNPLRVNPRNRKLKASRPRAVHLDTAEHIAAMLEAASLLDGAPCPTGGARTTGRRTALAVLLFAGLRAEEAGALRWRDVDLANGRLHVGRSKTSAGVREVDLLPILRDELAALKAAGRRTGPDDPVLLTSTGKPRDRHNLRQRVVAPIARKADELLAERDQRPLPAGLSPHKMRHTFASLLVALGNDPAYVMAQLGHTDPAFTLRAYTHMMRRDPGERERLQALVSGTEWAPLGTSAAIPESPPTAA